jgi:ABC-type lipoprotein release transport system permease subunit
MSILRMAWRNVWRNRRRTLVTVGATTLAFTVMVLYSSLLQGYMKSMENNLLDLEMGDVQIHDSEYGHDPSLYSSVEEARDLLARFDDKGFPASARLLGFGLGAAAEASAGVRIRGVEVARDARVSRIGERVRDGAWLAEEEPYDVVLGSQLARTLVVEPGDELVLLSQASDGSTANDLFVVRGVLYPVAEGVDRAGVFMTEAAFRQFYVFPVGAHEIIVRRPEGMDLETLAGAVAAIAEGRRVETWRELSPTLASMLDSVKGLMVVVFLIIYIAIGILILNAMLMAVFERIREFGVLKAIGYAPSKVFLIILSECAIITGLAIIAGLVLCVPGLWLLVNVGIDMGQLGGMAMMGVVLDPVWRGIVDPSVFTVPLVTLLFIVGLAALYPATKAAWISPIRAIQHR